MAESAAVRLRRVLAILPWLADRGSATFEEISSQFDLPIERVPEELMLVACCGLPPYQPDTLIEVLVFDDYVEATIPDYFERPMRLTAAEGFAVLAAGRTLLAIPGADPSGALGRAVEKLGAALGADGGLQIDLDAPEHLDELRRAVDARARVDMTYYSAGRDELTDRVVDPYRVWTQEGHWYVLGFCHATDERRRFRVDRIRRLDRTGDHFDPVDVADDEPLFEPDADTRTVRAVLPGAARWVIETYPTRSVAERPDGTLEVTIDVAGRAFLDRLLLRVGPEVAVLEPPEWRTAPADAASRVLSRYRGA